MNIWEILGIEETKDKNQITAAYRLRLRDANPEEKPEEFMALRKAYEEAMAFAESTETVSKSKAELWLDELSSLYADFSRRKDPKAWKELLSADICQSIDTRMEIEEKMIAFFMEKFNVPHEVWLYLDEEFEFSKRIEEFYERYPKDFVDYVIVNGIRYNDRLPASLFDPGVDGEAVDRYLSLYNKVRSLNFEDAKSVFEEIDECGEYHPFGEAYQLILNINNGHPELIGTLAALCEKYDYINPIAEYLAEVFLNSGEDEKCIETCDKGIEKNEETGRILYLKAQALASKREYKDAIEIIHKLMDLSDGNITILNDLDDKRHKWNDELLKDLLEKQKNDPDNDDLNCDISWALIQNRRPAEAEEYANRLGFEKPDPFAYYNVNSTLNLELDHDEKALEYMDKLIEVIRSLKEDGTEKTAKRIKRLGEMLSRKGVMLAKVGRMEESIDVNEEAVKLEPNDGNILTSYCRVLNYVNRYEEMAVQARKLIEITPNSYHGYYLLAKALFIIEQDRDSFNAINRSIELNSGDLASYLLKLRLLLRNSAFEAAKELIDFLEQNNIAEADFIYSKGLYEQYFNKDETKALELYRQAAEGIENNDQYVEAAERVYYSILFLTGKLKDANKKEDREELIAIAEKGLKINKDDKWLLDYYAWLLKRDERKDEALKIFMKLSEDKDHSADVDFQIGDIYYDDLDNHAEDSYEYLLRAREKGHRDTSFMLAFLSCYLDKLDESEQYCFALRQEAEEAGYVDIDSYYRMSFVHEKRKEIELAYEQNEIALEHAIERKVDLLRYINHKVRLLRMLNRFEEAAETVKKYKEKYNEGRYHDLLHEIYSQAGMFDKATEIFHSWKKVKDQRSEAVNEQVAVELMRYDEKAAKKLLNANRLFMTPHYLEEAKYKIDEFNNEFDKCIKHIISRIENDTKETDTYARIQLAMLYALKGDRKNKLEYGKKAFEFFNDRLNRFSQDKALDHIFRAKILICLEHYKEAKEEIEMARKSTCSFCKYCCCKDADQFETFLKLEMGEYDEVIDMVQKYGEKWNDETDLKAYRDVALARKNKK